MRKYFGIVVSLLLAMVFIHGNVSAKDDDVVAKIGDRKITISEFNKMLGYLDSEKQKLIEKNPQLKENLLQQYVQGIVISKLAKKKGFDKNPELKEQLELLKDNYIAIEYLKKEVTNKVEVSEEDIKAYYESHKDEFKTPEMVRSRHILIKTDPSASDNDKKKAKEKAGEILKKIKAGEDFAKLASDVSDDTGSKPKGGELGFFPKGRMVTPFEDAAFSLKPGEVSEIVETQFGYHIIKVEEKKEPGMEPFDTAKEKIRQKLLQERTKTKVTEFLEKAMKEANIELHPELLMGGKK
ncbi:MAG: peptidylprolyl isomerase [Nitrospira sp.]|nr:peptidylprolyl isomerase [Nitrospira sp.]